MMKNIIIVCFILSQITIESFDFLSYVVCFYYLLIVFFSNIVQIKLEIKNVRKYIEVGKSS